MGCSCSEHEQQQRQCSLSIMPSSRRIRSPLVGAQITDATTRLSHLMVCSRKIPKLARERLVWSGLMWSDVVRSHTLGHAPSVFGGGYIQMSMSTWDCYAQGPGSGSLRPGEIPASRHVISGPGLCMDSMKPLIRVRLFGCRCHEWVKKPDG